MDKTERRRVVRRPATAPEVGVRHRHGHLRRFLRRFKRESRRVERVERIRGLHARRGDKGVADGVHVEHVVVLRERVEAPEETLEELSDFRRPEVRADGGVTDNVDEDHGDGVEVLGLNWAPFAERRDEVLREERRRWWEGGKGRGSDKKGGGQGRGKLADGGGCEINRLAP